MECIIILFLIFLLLIFVNIKKIESFTNYQSVTLDDIKSNPEKAGSIDISKDKSSNKSSNNQNVYMLFSEDEIYKNLRNNKYFKELNKPENEIKVQESDKYYDEKYTPYSPYEKIIPPFDSIKRDKIQDFSNVPVITNKIDGPVESERILDENKDCFGAWSKWDESICNQSNRCGIKKKVYKIIKPSSGGGKACPHEDGEIAYEYCNGSSHETRCGLTYNVCNCDLDNYNAGKCNLDTMELECDCPEGYKLSNRGLCIIDTGEEEEEEEVVEEVEEVEEVQDDRIPLFVDLENASYPDHINYPKNQSSSSDINDIPIFGDSVGYRYSDVINFPNNTKNTNNPNPPLSETPNNNDSQEDPEMSKLKDLILKLNNTDQRKFSQAFTQYANENLDKTKPEDFKEFIIEYFGIDTNQNNTQSLESQNPSTIDPLFDSDL